LPFGAAIDNTGEIAKHFGNVQFTPTALLIDKRSHVVQRYIGTPGFPAMRQLIDKLLADS
jgi:protein-disulfide isomerase